MIDPVALGLAPILLPDGQSIWVRKASFASQAVAVTPMGQQARAMTRGDAVMMGAGDPMAPTHANTDPRRFAYQPGFNLRTSPRSTEAIPFSMLQALADSYGVARLVIEHRKNEFRGLERVIRPKPVPGMKREEAKARAADLDDQVAEATEFFRKPNREDPWSVWLGALLEDLFVIDAATLYLRPNRAGGLYSVDNIDGSTIRPIIDDWGRVPLAPAPAYGQVLFGRDDGQYTSDQIMYAPFWQRPGSAYGHPPLEWIILSVNRAIRRETIDLSLYTEGTLPVGFYKVPEQWNGEQIGALQTVFDGLLAGNDIQRSRVRFVPGGPGTGLEQVHQEPKTEVEEWLLYLTCAALGAKPTDIGFQPRGAGLGGKGFADQQQDSTIARATRPIADHVKGIVDEILADHLGMPELELHFPGLEKAEDILKRAQADDVDLKNGKRSVDELRERDELDPIGLGPYIAGSVTLVDDVLNPPDPVVPIDPTTGAPLQMPFGMTQPGAKPPVKPDQADPKADPKAADDKVAKVSGELGAWQRKAVKAVRAGRSAAVPFASDVLGPVLTARISSELAKVSSSDQVRAVFELAKAGASADPFASSSSASFAPSGPSTSASSAGASSTRPSSPRQPYP